MAQSLQFDRSTLGTAFALFQWTSGLPGPLVALCVNKKGAKFTLILGSLTGTALGNQSSGEVIYTPPEGEALLREKLANWERFIHEKELKVGREKLFIHPNFVRLLTSDDHPVPPYSVTPTVMKF